VTVSLASRRNEIEQAIRGARRIWLGLDFDGTVAAIADRPDRVEVSFKSQSLLRTLAGHRR
jgi:trehalose-6-phosphatase